MGKEIYEKLTISNLEAYPPLAVHAVVCTLERLSGRLLKNEALTGYLNFTGSLNKQKS
ncbi:MAG: hypothetical protein HY364_00125 [Candidatus Aenigmarchaeota archaeon]|nr:hypothetical protein [Candidatus Aenigmarchaeota archaeon]